MCGRRVDQLRMTSLSLFLSHPSLSIPLSLFLSLSPFSLYLSLLLHVLPRLLKKNSNLKFGQKIRAECTFSDLRTDQASYAHAGSATLGQVCQQNRRFAQSICRKEKSAVLIRKVSFPKSRRYKDAQCDGRFFLEILSNAGQMFALSTFLFNDVSFGLGKKRANWLKVPDVRLPK